MHLLLAASADSLWTKKYIEEILLPVGHEITVLSPQNTCFADFYVQSGVRVCTTLPDGVGTLPRNIEERSISCKKWLMKVPFLIAKRVLPRFIKTYILAYRPRKAVERAVQNLPSFDALHVHYVTPGLEYVYAPLLKMNTGSLILTYWGSDLFRNTFEPSNLRLLDNATAIVCVSESLKKYFHSIYGSDYDDRLHVLDFGVSVYDVIEQLEQKEDYRSECRKANGIPEEKLCVMVGYNANSGQQHLDILRALGRLPQAVKDKIHITLQFSYNYSDDEGYYKKINELLKRMSCSWNIIDRFLDDGQSAQLRSCVDIFIHAQISDALSASMLEYLYAGAIVLNGSWLRYEELDSRGIDYYRFDDFAQLTSLFEGVVHDFSTCKSKASDNRAALHAMNSWAAVKDRWLGLYK